MAAESAISSFSVGQISQLLSKSRKRKQDTEENSGLKSLFGTSFTEQPVFVAVNEKKKKKKTKGDKVSEEGTALKKKKSKDVLETGDRNKDSDDDDDNENVKLKPKKTKEDPERLNRTIFVGHVPVTLNKKDFKKLFDKYGEVESVRFRSAALAKPTMSRTVGMKRKEYHKDRQTLNGYVVFKDKSSAVDALQSNGVEVEGSHLRVDMAGNAKVHDHSKSVFVGNLSFGTEEEPLRELFKDCGEIESVRLIRDSKTNVGKGFGFVMFKSKDAVGFAIKLNQIKLKGRPIRVFPSSEHPSKGYNVKFKKGRPQTHSFSGIQAIKNQKVNKFKHMKRKEHLASKKGAKKGQPSKRSVAYKQELNKKGKTK